MILDCYQCSSCYFEDKKKSSRIDPLTISEPQGKRIFENVLVVFVCVELYDSKEEVEEARSNNETIKRFKGLGEFSPKDLKVFTLDESTRNLIRVSWSDKYEQLFTLMSSASERRKLVLGEWSLED